jgi:uncharacterized RDD family membrane protein YckC
MKCPKCHYLSFEPEPRCKHCGYSFSLSEPDLALRPADDSERERPFADFSMRDSDTDRPRGPMTLGPMRSGGSEPAGASAPALALMIDKPEREPDFPSEPPKLRPARSQPTTELPLFVKGLAEAEAGTPDLPAAESDQPLVKMLPAHARAPLAVRRASEAPRPQLARVEAEPARKLGPFDHDLLEDLQRIEAKATGRPAAAAQALAAGSGNAVRRVGAAVIDLAFLGAINAAVVWFTLRQCDLTWQQARVLPIGPMAAFLTLVVVGYLFLFTAASGQTIGKMLVGLRVVADPDSSGSDSPTIGQASYRALLTLPSVLVLGVGFLPALVRPGLAVHDRLAHTRVVRA